MREQDKDSGLRISKHECMLLIVMADMGTATMAEKIKQKGVMYQELGPIAALATLAGMAELARKIKAVGEDSLHDMVNDGEPVSAEAKAAGEQALKDLREQRR